MRWIYWIFGREKGKKRWWGKIGMGKKCKYIQERRVPELDMKKTADSVNVVFCVNKSVGKVGF
jgi:hypothetical protein